MNLLYDQFKNFHVFKKFKELISSWWNIDIFLVEKKGNEWLLPKGIAPNNKIVKSFLESDLFKRYLLQTMGDLSQKKACLSEEILTVSWKQAELEILAIPLLYQNKVQGYIVATGFLSPKKSLENLKQCLSYLNLSMENIDSLLLTMKTLETTDKKYIEKFLSLLVQECFSLIQEQQKQQEILKKFNGKDFTGSYGSLIGKSAPMQFLYNILNKLKDYENFILIRGESGTGKTLLAKIIHDQSCRSKEPLFIQDCSVLSDSLLESELFGHKKGAFEGASKDKKGLFEVADGGSVYLKKIGCIPPDIQSKILRFLQEGTFFPVGDTKSRKAQVRILASTDKNLEDLIKEKKFRDDLFYKLNVISLTTVPLRERKEDIPLLVQHFLKQKDPLIKKSFTPKAMKYLCEYSWPMNVSELYSEIERILVFCEKGQTLLTESTLSKKIKSDLSISKETPFELGNHSLKSFLRNVEKNIIIESLKKYKGNKAKVARLLGSSRTSIILKVKEYGLTDFKESS
ncbi:MAG: sigma 54-interacting transcriptional regulator [Bdellovibrionales bacterium]